MSSENTLTGRNGKFVVGTTLITKVTKWAVSKTLATKTEWGDSDGEGFTNRAAGRKDATFNAEGKYNSSSEQYDIFQPGDIAIAALWMDASSLYWAFPRALCMDFSLDVDIDGETVIGWTSAWGADGKFYFPGEAGAPTYTLP